jgi:hypothetical protein
VIASRAGETRPASVVGPLARRVFTLGGALAVVGAVLALAVPVFGLRSDACGSVNCGLLQVIGKALTSGGLALALGAIAVASIRAGRFSAGVLAALIAGPALLWTVMVVEDWRELQAGTSEATQVLAAARDYAAAQRGLPADQLRPIIVNGRGSWVSVRVTEPTGAELVLLERQNGRWTPRAIAPSFSKDELRAIGAPTDVARDE